MLILRIRQAECALADGRLDEAFEIAQAEDIRRHRYGQRLVGRLARAMVHRGQENLAANRFQAALLDCNKAEKLAGNLPEVAQLRAAVCSAVTKDQQGRRQDAARVAQAKQHIDNGWLSVGERILGEAPNGDGAAGLVRQELMAARLRTEDALAKAEEAVKRGDIEEAIEIARGAGLDQSKNGRTGVLLRQIRGRAVERIRADLEQGRVDRAQAFLQRLAPFGKDGAEVAELAETLAWCRQAAEHVVLGRPAEALPLLRKAKVVCPSAKWLDSAIADTKRAAEAYGELNAGPLGLTMEDAADSRKQKATGGSVKADGLDDAPRRHPQVEGPESDSLPSRFVMQIDGVGSFLVFRDSRLTIGPISAQARPMLGLIADANTPVILIERVDGDYFVRSQTPIEVNGQRTTERLLADGDRITLSPRCRIRFHLPNPASSTAVLTVSGARLSRPDIRQLVLMDRDILVGPYANNHVRTDQLHEPIALFAQNGRLLCRAKECILVDGHNLDPSVGLAEGKRIEIGKLSMVVAKSGE